MGLADYIKLGAHGFKPAEIKQFKTAGVSMEEVIRLSESGYSAADISELITLAGEGEQLQPGNNEEKEPHGPADASGNEGEDDKPDYKKEAEDAQKEAADLRKKLAEAQLKNANKDLSGGSPVKTAREQVQEAFRTLY